MLLLPVAASSQSTAVVVVDPPANSAPPSMSGVAQVAKMLTSSTGSWSGSTPFTYSYRWRRCDRDGLNCVDLPATSSTYKPVQADVGLRLRVVVTARNAAGAASAVSLPTAVVSAAGVTCSSATAPTGGMLQICIAEYPSAALANATTEAGTLSVTVSIAPTDQDTFGCTGHRIGPSRITPCVTWAMDGNYVLTDLWPPYTMTLHSGLYPAGQHTMTATTAIDGIPAVVTEALTVTGNTGATLPQSPNSGLVPQVVPRDPNAIVVAAVGDGAASQWTESDVAGRIASWNPDLMFYLGDVYQLGSYEEYLNFYAPQEYFGQFEPIAVHTPGNHEYQHLPIGDPLFADGKGYYWYTGYLNGPPSDPGRGASYFSFDLPNSWHVIDLNSEIPVTATSPQGTWLRQDLAAHPDSKYPCTIAIWHRPRVTTSAIRGDTNLQPLWNALAPVGVDIVLNGHAHAYERSLPLNRDTTLNSSGVGVVQLVVGTGGNGLNAWGTQPTGWVAYRTNTIVGALKLVLQPGQAQYEFQRRGGGIVYDAGTIPCRTGDVAPPTAPGLPAATMSPGQVQLSWTAAKDNVGVTGYQVFRDGLLLATTPGATTYADTTVAPGAVYQYKVRARDAAGNESLFSGTAGVTAG